MYFFIWSCYIKPVSYVSHMYVTICWGIFFKRNNTGTMFNWPTPLYQQQQPITNNSLGQSWYFVCAEYASVGYMAKRIQMRKNRFLAIQKMAEQKKNEALHASNANINDASNNLDLGPGLPKQTVSLFNALIDAFVQKNHTTQDFRSTFRSYLCSKSLSLLWLCCADFSLSSFFKPCLTQPQPPISRECPWD